MSAGSVAQTFVQNGNNRAEAYQEHELRFKAQAAKTKISIGTSLSGNGHHAPAIGYVYVVPFDPLQAGMQKDIEKAYSTIYSARGRRDFTGAFAFLSPDYQRTMKGGQTLDSSAYQTSIRNFRPPEGNPGTFTYEVRSVGPAKGSKNADAILIERYIYSRMLKDHNIHIIKLVTCWRDVWTPAATGWKLLKSTQACDEIYLDDKQVEAIP